MDDHMDAEDLVSGGDPYVMDLVQKVGMLAGALRSQGAAGLRSAPGMDKFELTLRGYRVGYFAGRRVEDDPTKDYQADSKGDRSLPVNQIDLSCSP